jgi:hypothetical protein
MKSRRAGRLARWTTSVVAASLFFAAAVHGGRPDVPEWQTLGDVRTIIAAEAAYQGANGGYYDTLECLVRPWDCIPGYGKDSTRFLDEELLSTVRAGFQREFHRGPAGPGLSPSSMRRYAYVAFPMEVSDLRTRGFCGDDEGRICFTRHGTRPAVDAGRCVIEPGPAPWLPAWLHRFFRAKGDPDPCYHLR